MLQLEEERTSPTKIKVAGVGGGGMNAVNRMIDAELKGVDFMVINTDEQVLLRSDAEEKIQIGSRTTRGMGAGGDPEIGHKAALEDRDNILQKLKGADMVFITAGMGGGTGTGAAPIIAEVAKELGALTVGVVTLPFAMEGGRRMEHARRGLDALKEKVDTLITIKNDSIFKVIDRNTSVDVAFRLVDDILLNAVKGISDLINTAGLVNVDFADVRSIMDETGDAIMGAGEGVGENRISDAVNQAINNTLLEDTSIAGATALLINVCGGEDMSITDWKEVSELITSQVDPEANIIIGLTLDDTLKDRIRVTVLATGFSTRSDRRAKPGQSRQQEPIREERTGVAGGRSQGTPPSWNNFPGERGSPQQSEPSPVVSIRKNEPMHSSHYSEEPVLPGTDPELRRQNRPYGGTDYREEHSPTEALPEEYEARAAYQDEPVLGHRDVAGHGGGGIGDDRGDPGEGVDPKRYGAAKPGPGQKNGGETRKGTSGNARNRDRQVDIYDRESENLDIPAFLRRKRNR